MEERTWKILCFRDDQCCLRGSEIQIRCATGEEGSFPVFEGKTRKQGIALHNRIHGTSSETMIVLCFCDARCEIKLQRGRNSFKAAGNDSRRSKRSYGAFLSSRVVQTRICMKYKCPAGVISARVSENKRVSIFTR